MVTTAVVVDISKLARKCANPACNKTVGGMKRTCDSRCRTALCRLRKKGGNCAVASEAATMAELNAETQRALENLPGFLRSALRDAIVVR
jgi:hypothetical protein